MSAPNPLIGPQTVTATAIYDAVDDDKVLFAINGVAIAAAETVTFSVQNSTAGTTPVYDSTGAQVKLTAALQSVMLEGGFRYVVVKSVTAANSGVDVTGKPRTGFR